MSDVEDEVQGRNPVLAVYSIKVVVRGGADAVPLTLKDLETRVEGILADAWYDGGVTVNATAERVD